jgi:hypothetical protein
VPVEVVRRDWMDCQVVVPRVIFCRVTGQLATALPCWSLTLVVAVIAVPTHAVVGREWVNAKGTMGAAQFAMVRVAPEASCATTLMVSFLEAEVKVAPSGMERL